VLLENDRQRRDDRRRDRPVSASPPANGNGHGGTDMAALARKYASNLSPERSQELAEALGLRPDVLARLPLLGYSTRGHHTDRKDLPCWTMPEANPAGKVTGLVCRYQDGEKKAMTGSGRALVLLDRWDTGDGPVYAVEGHSDSLAMAALGLSVVGRPSNTGGVQHLAELLREQPAERDIIIVAEWDPKADGKWPGVDGAKSTAAALARQLGRPVKWALPPEGAKDVRKWLLSQNLPGDCLDAWHEAGAKLSAYLTENAILVKPAGPADASESFTATDLMQMELPEARFAVNNVIPEGLSVLAAKPKLGKSWLALNLGNAISEGGVAVGAIDVEAGDVLYLALEDNKRRLQSRLNKMLSAQLGVAPARLTLVTRCPRQHEGGIEFIEEWLGAHPGARLVIIDVWMKFRPPKKAGTDDYEQDYAHAAQLKALADKYQVAILVVAHCRKMDAEDPVDSVRGTLGLTGACDGVLVMKRERGQHDATLFVTGRDIEERELALRFDPQYALWSILGDAEEFRITGDRSAVVQLLKKAGKPMKPSEAAPLLGKTLQTVKQLFWRMDQAGQLKAMGNGYYCITNAHELSPVSPQSPPSPESPALPFGDRR
jgi:hypothetical protein